MAKDKKSSGKMTKAKTEAVGKEKAAGKVKTAGRRIERYRTALLVAVQVIFIGIVFLQLNYLSCRRHTTWDLTQNSRFTLSDTTGNYLRNMGSEVRIVMAFLGTSELFTDVKGLISEYGRVGGDSVTAEFLDLSRSKSRLTELSDKYQLEFNRNQIVILGDNGRIKTIPAEELVTRDSRSGRVLEFRGEEILTAALLEVTEQQQRKIYMITGDRRAEDIAGIASQMQPLINAQNARLDGLVLEGLQDIPADADVLVFPGNTSDLTDRELELVRNYWESKKGGLVVLLNPGEKTPNLNSLLRENGIGPRPDRVMSVVTIPGLAAQRIYDVPITMMPGDGPTRDLPALSTRLSGHSQSLEVLYDDELLLSENVKATPLMIVSGEGFWGETDFLSEDVSYNPDIDYGRPDLIFTAASVEKGMPGDSELLEGSSRMVVVGNPDLIAPDGNTSKVNADFAMASINWVMNREELMGISPRRPTAFTLNVSPGSLGFLHSLVILLIPGMALLAGLFVWMKRRA
ncbi:MAG: Gldg family protein [Verrucomicrobiales bacterium]|nr:Gldg family protein [Verrucomicrobiales bacterium]